MKRLTVILLTFLLISSMSNADQKMDTTHTFSAAFNKLKLLEGVWEGTKGTGEHKMNITVKYQVTSAGSSVVETLFPGKPFEMVSVYNDVDGKVQMTHYCALHNQPTMKLQSSKDNILEFNFIKGTNLNPNRDKHMHNLVLKILEKDKIVHEWTEYENGKPGKTSVFRLARVN